MINSTQENLVLRYRYPEFVFESFEYYRNADGIKADYVYKLGEHTFKPSVEIPTSDIRNEEIDDNNLEDIDKWILYSLTSASLTPCIITN